MTRLRSLALAVGLATLGGPALAKEVMDGACVGAAPATRTLVFENSEHRRWHRRFWTGNCSGLGLVCASGSPFWNQEAAGLIARAPASDRRAIRERVCRLGQRIGHEWARDNSVRRINSSELRAYYNILSAGSDVDAVLATVESRVNRALGAD